MTQDIHSISEFYLGPELGWRRVEPEATGPVVPEEYGLIMHLVLPEDERADALQDRWIAGGAPFDTMSEVRAGADAVSFSMNPVPTFTDYTYGINRADRQAVLRGTAAEMADVFAAARRAWAADQTAYVGGGGPSAARLATRHRALEARTFDEVKALVAGL
jgi:hypothetical protein